MDKDNNIADSMGNNFQLIQEALTGINTTLDNVSQASTECTKSRMRIIKGAMQLFASPQFHQFTGILNKLTQQDALSLDSPELRLVDTNMTIQYSSSRIHVTHGERDVPNQLFNGLYGQDKEINWNYAPWHPTSGGAIKYSVLTGKFTHDFPANELSYIGDCAHHTPKNMQKDVSLSTIATYLRFVQKPELLTGLLGKINDFITKLPNNLRNYSLTQADHELLTLTRCSVDITAANAQKQTLELQIANTVRNAVAHAAKVYSSEGKTVADIVDALAQSPVSAELLIQAIRAHPNMQAALPNSSLSR